MLKKILNILIVSTMNDNENIYKWISRYNEGELNGKEMDEFLKILSSNPEIRSDIELDKELTEFLQDKDLIEFRRILDQARVNRRRGFGMNCLLIAALLTALVAFGGFWLYQNPFGKHPMIKNGVAETLDKQKSKAENSESVFLRNAPGFSVAPFSKYNLSCDNLAANFRPLGYMEGMVGVVSRAGNFHLLSLNSQITIIPGDTLRFRWEEDVGGHLSFLVMNNRGEFVASRDSIFQSSLAIPTILWTEGLYYWKFIHRDNLVSVGKIIIRR